MTTNLAMDLAIAIRRAAEAAQACVVDGFPEQGDRTAVLLVQLEQEDAVRLISAALPKAVYLVEVAFAPDEEIADATETLADIGVEKLSASLTAAHRRVAGHAREIKTTLAGFMVDGVLHTSSASAAWHDAFDEVVDEVLARQGKMLKPSVGHRPRLPTPKSPLRRPSSPPTHHSTLAACRSRSG